MRKLFTTMLCAAALLPTAALSLSAEELDTSRDYFEYTDGDGKVTINFENLDSIVSIDAYCGCDTDGGHGNGHENHGNGHGNGHGNHGNGHGNGNCEDESILDNVNLYKINGESDDVHSTETDDELIEAVDITENSITWDIEEDAFYYVNLADSSNTRSAFGADLISCYLWLNADENSVMNLDVTELSL